MKKLRNNSSGFTLVEVIAVLVILGILAAVAIPKYIDLQVNAELRALDAGIAELNGRAALKWGNEKLSDAGWTGDTVCDTDLGTDYDSTGLTAAGGDLDFGSQTKNLSRDAATTIKPAKWYE